MVNLAPTRQRVPVRGIPTDLLLAPPPPPGGLAPVAAGGGVDIDGESVAVVRLRGRGAPTGRR